MSAEAAAWAWRQAADDLGANLKFLLVAIADGANEAGLYVGGKKPLAVKTGAGVSTVTRNLGKLEETGYLKRQQRFRADGGRGEDELQLRLAPPSQNETTPVSEQAVTPVSDRDGPRAGVKNSSTTSLNGHSARGALAIPLDAAVPDEMVADAEEFLRRKQKVGTHVVRPEEMSVAAVCMATFNQLAGTDQGLGPNLTRIVGRIREHPSWDHAKHVRLLHAAFEVRWWERNGQRRPGAVTPAVIYGSSECFVNVANDAADLAAGREREIEQRRGKYDRAVVRDD